MQKVLRVEQQKMVGYTGISHDLHSSTAKCSHKANGRGAVQPALHSQAECCALPAWQSTLTEAHAEQADFWSLGPYVSPALPLSFSTALAAGHM